MRHSSCLPLLLLLVTPAVAQTRSLGPRAFLPEGHETVLFADLAKLRASGVWDDLEVSALKMVLPQIEKELGFPLARLDRATLVVLARGEDHEPRRLVMFEGNAELAIPDRVARGVYDQATIGDQVVYRHRIHAASVFVRPRPEMQVMGDDGVIAPVLRGERGPGAPSADALSLLARRGDSLVYALVALDDAAARAEIGGLLFPGAQWPAGDAPTHVLLRGRTVGDPDDPHAEVELVIRHRGEGEGIVATEAAVDALVERLRKEPALVALRSTWRTLQQRRDRCDLCVTLDLGRTRDAVGRVAALAAAFWLRPIEAVQVVPAVPVPEPEQR